MSIIITDNLFLTAFSIVIKVQFFVVSEEKLLEMMAVTVAVVVVLVEVSLSRDDYTGVQMSSSSSDTHTKNPQKINNRRLHVLCTHSLVSCTLASHLRKDELAETWTWPFKNQQNSLLSDHQTVEYRPVCLSIAMKF